MVNFFKKLWKEEDGIGTLEIILIIAVLVVIVLLFRKQLMAWVEKLFDSTNKEIDNINKPAEEGIIKE